MMQRLLPALKYSMGVGFTGLLFLLTITSDALPDDTTPIYPIIPVCQPGCLPVTGFAQRLGSITNLANVNVIPVSYENFLACNPGLVNMRTSAQGTYGFCYPAGKKITVIFEKSGYQTSQSATIDLGYKGRQAIGLYHNISYQAINSSLLRFTEMVVQYSLLTPPVVTQLDPEKCQVVITVTKFHKTLYDSPQGEPGVVVSLVPEGNKQNTDHAYYDKLFYFRELLGKTLPIGGLKKTSKDGGVMILNLKPGHYHVLGHKSGVTFRPLSFTCDPGLWKKLAPEKQVFINLSPPQGLQVESDQ